MSSNGEFNKVERFECSCGNWQDYVVVTYDRWKFNSDTLVDEDCFEDDLSLHVQMNHFLPWYKRAFRAMLYVIAKDAKWFHWSETMLSYKDAVRMRDLLNEYIESPHTDKSK